VRLPSVRRGTEVILERGSAIPSLLVSVAIVAVAAALGAASVARWWPLLLPGSAGRPLPGLRVEGQALSGGVDVRAEVDAMARALRERRVRFVAGGSSAPGHVVAEGTLGALGVAVDVEATASEAMRVGRAGDAVARARCADRARRGAIDVPLELSFDPRPVFSLLAPLKEDIDVPSVAARLDLKHGTIVEERDGKALDLDAAAAAVERAGRNASGSEPLDIELPFTPVPSAVTRDALARIDVSRVLASFDTYFSRRGDQEPRARNIEVAAAHVDGLVVRPGEVESFNDVVGARSEENGFFKAFEIYKGEFVEGMGGGTCQVASTVHAAAFFGGLDVVERLPHSRPSAYIPPGLDATVVYPTVDLKIRNPFSFPVVFRATVGANVLHVELLGAERPVAVQLRKEVLSTTPFDRKVVEDRAFAQPKRTQKGSDGVDLRRSRILVYVHGPTRVETSLDRYPPTLEVWKVPPGFDAERLPPLGEDAASPESAPADGPPASTGEPAAVPPPAAVPAPARI
jgi:vancomycin resistance protein YoaR